ncbi:DUF3459 domain-containing protein [Nocardioides zeae]
MCSQNHDQIGNRARGDRLTEHLDDDQLATAALLTLCTGFTPMLFQGEEWAASSPFQFFTSHPEPELGKATAEGRIEEFAKMGWDPAVVPDPQDPETFTRSKLDWSELAEGRHAVLLEVYRSLARLRRSQPDLLDPDFTATSCEVDESARVVRVRRRSVELVLALGTEGVTVDVPAGRAVVWATPGGYAAEDAHVVVPAHGAVVVADA